MNAPNVHHLSQIHVLLAVRKRRCEQLAKARAANASAEAVAMLQQQIDRLTLQLRDTSPPDVDMLADRPGGFTQLRIIG